MSSGTENRVFGIGNALVDFQVEVEDSFLERLGVEKGGMSLVDSGRQREVLEALKGVPVHRCSGGSAANTIAGIADLGGAAAYCGRVADDDLGSFYRSDLRELGVDLHGARSKEGTGTSVVLVTPDAQRTMLTHLGVSSELTGEDVTLDAVQGASHVYVEGYLFTGEGTTAAALKAVELAQETGAKVALTASDAFVIGMSKDLMWDLIKGPVDLLFCNEEEAKALTGESDPIECARALHAEATNVALTLGANGALLMHEGEVHPIEGVPVRAVDTTGAGDMFAAGLLHGIASGMGWAAAGRLASHAAARVVEQMGARLSRKFTPAEIQALSDPR